MLSNITSFLKQTKKKQATYIFRYAKRGMDDRVGCIRHVHGCLMVESLLDVARTSFQGERTGPNAPSRSCKWRLKVDWWVSVGKWITVQSINEGTLLETWLLFAAWVSLKEFVKQWLSQTNSVYGLACWSVRPQDSDTAGHCNGPHAFCFLDYIPLTVTVWKQRRTRRNYSIYLWLKQIWICVAACLWILTNKKKSHRILHFNFGVVPQTIKPSWTGQMLGGAMCMFKVPQQLEREKSWANRLLPIQSCPSEHLHTLVCYGVCALSWKLIWYIEEGWSIYPHIHVHWRQFFASFCFWPNQTISQILQYE